MVKDAKIEAQSKELLDDIVEKFKDRSLNAARAWQRVSAWIESVNAPNEELGTFVIDLIKKYFEEYTERLIEFVKTNELSDENINDVFETIRVLQQLGITSRRVANSIGIRKSYIEGTNLSKFHGDLAVMAIVGQSLKYSNFVDDNVDPQLRQSAYLIGTWIRDLGRFTNNPTIENMGTLIAAHALGEVDDSTSVTNNYHEGREIPYQVRFDRFMVTYPLIFEGKETLNPDDFPFGEKVIMELNSKPYKVKDAVANARQTCERIYGLSIEASCRDGITPHKGEPLAINPISVVD